MDFEWYSFQTEIYTEYWNRDVTDDLKRLRDRDKIDRPVPNWFKEEIANLLNKAPGKVIKEEE